MSGTAAMTDSPMTRSRMPQYLLLAASTAIGATLRFYQLGHESLWLDEGFTFTRMKLSWLEMLMNCYGCGQGPFYYLVTRPWCDLAGTSETTLRLPAAVFGSLCFPLLFLLAKQLWNARVGLHADWFLAINPFAVQYAQEARPYSLLLLLSLASYLTFLRLLRESGRANSLVYITLTVMALYTHPYSVFLLFSQFLIIAVKEYQRGLELDFRRLARRYWPCLIIIAEYLPQFAFWACLYVPGTDLVAWIREPTVSDAWRMLGAQWVSLPLAVTVWTIIAAVGFWKFREFCRADGVLFFAAASLSFLVIPWLVSYFWRPMLSPRYTLPLLPFVIITLAAAISQFRFKLQLGMSCMLTLLAVASLHKEFSLNNKKPWRQIAAELHSQLQPGDVVVPSVPYEIDILRYYLRPAQTGIRLEHVASDDSDACSRLLDSASRVWVVAGNGNTETWRRVLQNDGPPSAVIDPSNGSVTQRPRGRTGLRAECIDVKFRPVIAESLTPQMQTDSILR